MKTHHSETTENQRQEKDSKRAREKYSIPIKNK